MAIVPWTRLWQPSLFCMLLLGHNTKLGVANRRRIYTPGSTIQICEGTWDAWKALMVQWTHPLSDAKSRLATMYTYSCFFTSHALLGSFARQYHIRRKKLHAKRCAHNKCTNDSGERAKLLSTFCAATRQPFHNIYQSTRNPRLRPILVSSTLTQLIWPIVMENHDNTPLPTPNTRSGLSSR